MLPTNVTTIVLGTTTDFNFPAGQTLFFRDIQLERSEVTLTADCDWRGLNQPIDFKVNLAGHTLKLASLAGPSASSLVVTPKRVHDVLVLTIR